MERIVGMEERGTTGGPPRWTLLVVATIAAITGAGYVAREPDAAPARAAAEGAGPATPVPASDSPIDGFRLQQPVEGSVITGNTIVVRGSADRPLGQVHIAAIAGTTELGTTDAIVGAAGAVVASVSIVEPPWPVAIELRISASTGRGSSTTLATRALVANPQPGVALTRVAARRAGDHLVLSVDGVAGTRLESIGLRLLSAGGARLAAVTPKLGAAEGWGGVLVASRPFSATVEADAMAPGTPLYLVLSWRDPVSGDLASAAQPMSVPGVQPADPMRQARS